MNLKIDKNILAKFIGILFILLAFAFPVVTESYWFNIVVKIRNSINTGDSGSLLLASGYTSILFALLNTLLFLGIDEYRLVIEHKIYMDKLSKQDFKRPSTSVKKTSYLWVDQSGSKLIHYGLLASEILVFIVMNLIISNVYQIPWEIWTSLISFVFILILVDDMKLENQIFKTSVVSLQVFFAFQWLNIMPILSDYGFGISDVPISIKLASNYLSSETVLNFMGSFFFVPTIFAAVMTAILFQIHDKNIMIVSENYEKEKELQMIKSKAMENRIYEEINSLAHDLKTPLVTIRGLNSLFVLSKNIDKLSEYSERIDGAVEKMSEMISSFLYGSSRQKIKPSDLVRYIQAQIPIEDDKLNVDIKIGENLSDIYVNKIRVVRALINLVENAILVPTLNEYKLISIEAKECDGSLNIIVSDNGEGIEPSIIDDIWKIGHSTNNTTGLGLPFAKQIVEENEGSIKIESELSVGTDVIVTFPFIEEDNVREDI